MGARYEADRERIERAFASGVDARGHAALCQLAREPEKLHGYGHVREAHSAQLEQALETVALLEPREHGRDQAVALAS